MFEELENKRILVTGGAGFIGSNIVEFLTKIKAEVVVIDDLSTGRKENLNGIEGFEFIDGSITRDEDLEKAREIDFILHQAAIPSVPRSVEMPIESSEVNIMGTLKVLDFARKKDVKRVVLASSSSIYGDSEELPKREDMPYKPKSPYALSKAVNEMHAKLYTSLYGIETVCLRYFNVYGKRQNPFSQYSAVIPKFITLMLKGESPVIFGDGKQSRDFTYVEDVVKANLLSLLSRDAVGESINIAGGKRITLLELVDMLNKIIGREIKPVFGEERKGDVKHSLASIEKAEKLLGWKPETSLEIGLRETVEWYKKKYKE